MAKPRKKRSLAKLKLAPPRRLSMALAALFAIAFIYGGYRLLSLSHASSAPLAIRISGNQLINAQGQTVRLVGVDQFGHCESGVVLHTPMTQSSINLLLQYHINAVRIIMNEDCWLGINGAPGGGLTAASLHTQITSYVSLLNQNGVYVIFDLHTNGPGTYKAGGQQVMADEDHAIDYWDSVAGTFKSYPAVILEPYNEPHITTQDAVTTNPWACWRDGCEVTEYNYSYTGPKVPLNWQGAGMQQLVDTIRAAGATNVITLGGLSFSNDLSQILTYLPKDPLNQEAATFHSYKNWGCGTSTCWNNTIAAVAAKIPVITDEMGQHGCGSDYVSQYMNWADSHGVSYLAWTWVPGSCDPAETSPSAGDLGLLNASGTGPNPYGQVILSHIQQIAPSPTPPPTKTPTPTTTPTPPSTSTPTPSETPSTAPSPSSAPPGTGGSSGGTGTLNFGTGAPATVAVNGQVVSKNGSLNTTYLTNGTHTVSVTQNGKTKTQIIQVHNKLNPFQTLRNFLFARFVAHPLVMNLGTLFVLLIPLAGLALVLKHLLAKKLSSMTVRTNLR